MNYKISPGISEAELVAWLKRAGKQFGTFSDGRVNYTDADIAPVVMCTIVCGDEILLVKRGFGLADAEGYWSTVNGFFDEIKPVKAQAKQEVKEELGLIVDDQEIQVRPSYTMHNPQEKRRYIIFPCRITLSQKPTNIVLDYENTDYVWITRQQLEGYHILDDLPHAIDAALQA
jgi:hypothetical protein